MTEQEEMLKQFLRTGNVEFESQKHFLGYGNKRWRVDFYLPKKGMIIECKDYERTQRWGSSYGIKALFSDMYKLDELGEKYELQKVLYLNPKQIYNLKTFIDNATAHEIFVIIEPIQLYPIFQGIEYKKQNETLFPVILPSPKIPQCPDRERVILWKWAVQDQTAKALGLHSMQLNRMLKKFMKNVLTQSGEKIDD